MVSISFMYHQNEVEQINVYGLFFKAKGKLQTTLQVIKKKTQKSIKNTGNYLSTYGFYRALKRQFLRKLHLIH